MRQIVTERIAGIDAARIARLAAREAEVWTRARPRSAEALAAGAEGFLQGVPMLWMRDWPQPFPMLVAEAQGATITDIDGHALDDFCLGDTGSMFGHSPPPVARAIARQAARGLTVMLPTEDALEVGRLLREVLHPLRWQVATTASDANRFALRAARAATGRAKVLVFAGCYHGAVDDSFVRPAPGGGTEMRPGLLGQVADLTAGSVCVEWNDLPAVEAALAAGDVAAVLAEPVMTNCCMVLPEAGFLPALRDACTRAGTLLILDETHTISSARGGYAKAQGIAPDLFVLGKPVAGGLPAAVWGMTDAVAEAFAAADAARPPGFSGIGTTLSANPLQFAAMRACLSEVMTEAAYAHMERGAARLHAALSASIAQHGLPWHVVRVGARVEFICAPGPLRTGSAGVAAHRPALEGAIHMALANRGCLIAPFHNMMLVSPVTTDAQIDRLAGAFAGIVAELAA